MPRLPKRRGECADGLRARIPWGPAPSHGAEDAGGVEMRVPVVRSRRINVRPARHTAGTEGPVVGTRIALDHKGRRSFARQTSLIVSRPTRPGFAGSGQSRMPGPVWAVGSEGSSRNQSVLRKTHIP